MYLKLFCNFVICPFYSNIEKRIKHITSVAFVVVETVGRRIMPTMTRTLMSSAGSHYNMLQVVDGQYTLCSDVK